MKLWLPCFVACRVASTTALACMICLSSTGFADQTELFTPAHVAKIRSVTDAVISPDGESIAYSLAVQRKPFVEPDGPAWTELHVADRQGNSRPFVTGKIGISAIQWTPDGKRIAYVAKRNDDKTSSIYTIPIDGGESIRLFTHTESLASVSFSPVDSRIAFIATESVAEGTKKLREQGFNQEIYEEDYLPTYVWIVDPSSSEPARKLTIEGSALQVEWSSDAKKLLVEVAPTPLVDDTYMFKRVIVVDADTSKIITRISNPGKLGQTGLSPDARHVAIISGVALDDPMEGHLQVASTVGDGVLRDLTPDLDGHVTSFAWRDANSIVAVVDQHMHTAVRLYTLDGTSTTLVEPSGPVLSNIKLAGDGKTASLIGNSPTHPPELFVLAEGEQPVKLTNSNPWLERMRFAQQSVVQWNARDGLELEGVLVKPLNYEEGQRYPLILTVHGGPEAHVPNGWVTNYSNAGQVGAARGFAVFYPNYRGSTGRGYEFSKLGQADAAGKEFDDLVDAIDHLSVQGLVDSKKVGITGGSYGGYASAWGATYYSDRYAASVMFVGISDNFSKVGTTDIPEEMFLVHHLKRLWNDWDYFIQRSPIRHIEKNKTPTLIMHGKNDPRVHPSQSLEFFRHLKTLKQAPVRLVLFEGEGHGNRKAGARLDYNLRLLQWMEHYLQGPGGPPPEYQLDYEKMLGAE